nr:MAG TPA: hypothetical protein [Caudoviricetes sp.]
MCGFLRFRLSEFELLPVQVAAFEFSDGLPYALPV